MEFQGDEGLKADGVVEDQTWRALQDFNPATVSRGLSQSRSGQQLVVFAKRYLGTPYVWGGASPSGFDCSGFIVYVFKQFGVQLPRMADEQFEVGSSVARADLQPGDMVFFTTYEPGPSHVGIYIGGGQFLHASSAVGEVTVTPLSKEYYQERYLGARRVLR
jgi:cell wall-associated NlpC family hydrolase